MGSILFCSHHSTKQNLLKLQNKNTSDILFFLVFYSKMKILKTEKQKVQILSFKKFKMSRLVSFKGEQKSLVIKESLYIVNLLFFEKMGPIFYFFCFI